jgi:tetratricopeptide (TPR) repeat protein
MTPTIEEAARHYAVRDLAEAARVCLAIIHDDPRHFDALHLLGVICTNRGHHSDGVSYLLRADAIRRDDARLQANLGAAYGAVHRFDKAVEAYQRAVGLGHRDAGVLNNLGLALRGLEREDDAIATFRSAFELDPGHMPTLYNLARARVAAGQFTEAEADLRLLLDRLPADTPAERVHDALNELARLLTETGRAEAALSLLRDAAAKHPDASSMRWHEALLLLLLGRFDEAWRAYETRWEQPEHDRPHPDYRVLDLNQVAGQRVLVREEQGRGDNIQFLRYLRPLAARGARVLLSTYHDLVPLARELPEVELVLGPDTDVAEYDLLTSLLSLPLAFGTTLETIPAEVPYLRVPAARIGRMQGHLGERKGRRIGLAWSGSIVSHPRAAIPAAALEPLLRGTDAEFHCLQKEILPADRSWLEATGRIATHEAMLADFADTAALVDAMDLVISIDTAVAHLAGALAKPVWIMLAFNPDWRWLLGRDDSPWYPTARLFRQSAPRDWDSVALSVAEAFHAL